MTGQPRNLFSYHHYSFTGSARDLGPLVLIHGWGCDSRTWQPVLAQLRELASVIAVDLPGFGANQTKDDFSLAEMLDRLEYLIPPSSILIGWSLGGMLAVALAARMPEKIQGVITLAANLRFVAAADYATAMPLQTYTQFVNGFMTDPQTVHKKFMGLTAQGDANERSLLKALRSSHNAQPTCYWQQTLAWLSAMDNRADFASLVQPGLHLFGEADALVPVTAATVMAALNPRQQIHVLPGTAHALHWSQPQNVLLLIKKFITEVWAHALPVPALDKRKVAQSFSRAAATYDSVAGLQRQVGEQLLQQLPQHNAAQWVLDLGCGTGFFTHKLSDRFSGARVAGLDIAEGMLHLARSRTTSGPIAWLGGDGECLPLCDNSLDVIFSNLAIQWCEQLPQLFAELWRVLKPGGYLLVSTLGPDTLRELKAAWQTVDGYVHVNRFPSATDVKAVATAAGFALIEWHAQPVVLTFAALEDLMRELKALGAHNVNAGQGKGLTGRRKFTKLKAGYERFRSEGRLPATYEVYCGVLGK